MNSVKKSAVEIAKRNLRDEEERIIERETIWTDLVHGELDSEDIEGSASATESLPSLRPSEFRQATERINV